MTYVDKVLAQEPVGTTLGNLPHFVSHFVTDPVMWKLHYLQAKRGRYRASSTEQLSNQILPGLELLINSTHNFYLEPLFIQYID